jgi:dGTPase
MMVLKDIHLLILEAADDICYTIIDFEDGINLGLVSEDFAEYLIQIGEDIILLNIKHLLLRKIASVICDFVNGSLINDSVKVHRQRRGNFKRKIPFALTDKQV